MQYEDQLSKGMKRLEQRNLHSVKEVRSAVLTVEGLKWGSHVNKGRASFKWEDFIGTLDIIECIVARWVLHVEQP
jgi:hypothetical protein